MEAWFAWAQRLNIYPLWEFYSDRIWTNYTPGYRIRGTSNLLLQAAAYYDPSLAAIQGAGQSQTDPMATNDNPKIITHDLISTAGKAVGRVGQQGE